MNHFTGDLGIPSESDTLRIGINAQYGSSFDPPVSAIRLRGPIYRRYNGVELAFHWSMVISSTRGVDTAARAMPTARGRLTPLATQVTSAPLKGSGPVPLLSKGIETGTKIQLQKTAKNNLENDERRKELLAIEARLIEREYPPQISSREYVDLQSDLHPLQPSRAAARQAASAVEQDR